MDQEFHYRCVKEVRAAIVALGLPECPADRVYARKLITDRNCIMPCVQVAFGGAEEDTSTLTGSDDWGWPVAVAILVSSNANYELEDSDSLYLFWRKRIRKAFHGKRLPAIPEVQQCYWRPSLVIDPALWDQANLWVQGGTVLCMTRERRD